MPMYLWESETTGEEITVLRSFDDYEVPPTEEEIGDKVGPWKRIVGRTTVVRGPNFTGSKGNW